MKGTMQTPHKMARRTATMGQPLPDIYHTLARNKAHFRRAGTSMIAGPAGSFKSTLALNLAIGWVQKGQRGLYVSADSDGFTVTKRCAAIITADPMDMVEKTIRSGAYEVPLETISDLNFECRGLSVKQV